MIKIDQGGGKRRGIFCTLLQSSHSLPNRARWEDTLQEVPYFIGLEEQKRGRICCTPESGHSSELLGP